MRNIKLTIQYDGTRYSGWQRQKNGRSIQETIESVIKKITGKHSNLKASGRTDAGVHAEAQVANFRTSACAITLKRLQMALNSALPPDITVTHIEEAAKRFDAQHDAKSKLYRYTIVNNDFIYPLLRHYAAKCFYRLDTARMRQAARHMTGRRNFAVFQASGSNEKNTVRTVKWISIEKKKDLVYIYVEADGFLYNMVRTMVGTLIEAGRGKISPALVGEMIAGRERRLAGPTMPAKGLALVKVRY